MVSKLTKASKGMDCIRCGAPDAYSCHYNGTYQHWYGKGRGIKANDLCTAEFCYNCDQLHSEGRNIYHNREEKDAQFLHFIMMTNLRRIENGLIKL